MTPAFTPRPGSSIDRAVRVLQASGGALPRPELARLIEREDEEVDGLLRYGVRMGLLRREVGDDLPAYTLGDGTPVEETAAEPAPAPVLVRQVVAEPVRVASPAPAAPPEPAAPAAPGHRIGCATYAPRAGSKTSQALARLHALAPHGGDAWLTGKDFAAVRIEPQAVQEMLAIAEKHRLVLRRLVDGRQQYQLGPAAVVMAAEEPKAVAQAPAPSPVPRRAPDPAPAPCKGDAGAALALPSQQAVPAQSDDIASFLLAQLDTEIARLEHNLRMVRRRKEAFELALDGARPHSPSPQSERATGSASVGWRT